MKPLVDADQIWATMAEGSDVQQQTTFTQTFRLLQRSQRFRSLLLQQLHKQHSRFHPCWRGQFRQHPCLLLLRQRALRFKRCRLWDGRLELFLSHLLDTRSLHRLVLRQVVILRLGPHLVHHLDHRLVTHQDHQVDHRLLHLRLLAGHQDNHHLRLQADLRLRQLPFILPVQLLVQALLRLPLLQLVLAALLLPLRLLELPLLEPPRWMLAVLAHRRERPTRMW